MDFKKSKKYTESYKTEFLNKLNEGKMVDVQEGQNLKVAEVSKELPKNAKIEKDEKQSFEDYKTMYKDVITQKCIEDYGVDTDTKLWEDTAKELYLKSKTYIPTGEEKSEEVLVKKEESKSLKENKNPEDLTTIEEIEEYINNIQDEHTKNILHYILEDEKQQENPNIGYLTMAIRKVFEVENSREKKTEDFNNNTKFLAHILNGVVKDIQSRFDVEAAAEFTKDEDEIVIYIKGNTLDLIDATSYLAKTIRRDDVDFEFDENISDNTIKCYIAPKNKMESLQKNNTNLEYNYMLLDRLKTDCEYFLGNGNGYEKHLWAGDIDSQIAKMKELYNSFADDEKPEWITMEDINNYEKEMKELKTNKEKKTEDVSDLQTIQDIEEYINNIKDEHTKLILHHILEDEKSKENPSIGYLTMAIRKVLDIEQERNKEKKTEVTERDLSKDLFQNEANRRIYNRLINLDVYLEQLKRAIENNDTDSIIANKSKIRSNVAYLIPSLNIIGGVKGLIDYLKTTDFDFENNFKVTADLIKDLDNKNKKEETVVTNYTLNEIKKVIDSNGNDFTIKIVNSNEDIQTKTLNIDREDLISIFNVLGGNKDSLQEDQYENKRRRGKPSIKKIAEDEYYDNQGWYIQHIKDYVDEDDFIEKEIAEIAEEYNLKEDTARSVCKEIYGLAKDNGLLK